MIVLKILFPNAIQRFEFVVSLQEFPTDHFIQDFEMVADKDSVYFGSNRIVVSNPGSNGAERCGAIPSRNG